MPSIIKGWLICILGSFICMALMAYKSNMQNPDYADSRQYIASAYNLSNYGIYSQNIRDGANVEPAIGREPGFPYALSFLFDLKLEEMSAITPTCLSTPEGCGLKPYASAQWLNRLLFALAGIVTFWASYKIFSTLTLASIGGASIWLNPKMQSSMDQVVSDPLALFLVCSLTLSFIFAAKTHTSKNTYLFASFSGIILGLLILTKAVFLYFLYAAAGLGLIYLLVFPNGRKKLNHFALPMLLFVVFAAMSPALWMKRNSDISGQYSLTDSREGIALSARNIFHDMSVAEYFTAFLYWTPSFGDNLARRYLPESAWKRFDTRNPDGFFLAGHHNFGKDVRMIVDAQGISRQEATAIQTRALKKDIITNPIKHIITTIPLFYRGIIRDIFILLSFPGLIFLTYRCLKRNDILILVALSPALFNMIFYPLISLNVGRYQITAAPAFAFGLIAFFITFSEWRKRKKINSLSSTA